MIGVGRILAVSVREVRDLLRRKTTFVLRTLYAAVIGVLVFGALALASLGTDRMMGSQAGEVAFLIFTGLTFLQSYGLVALGVSLAVASINSERTHRTIGLMLLSGVRPIEIVIGKTLGLLGVSSLILLAGLPSLAIIGWGGGIDYAWILRFCGLAFVLAALGIVAGILCACRLRAVPAGIVALGGITLLLLAPEWLARFGARELFGSLALQTAINAAASQGVAETRFAGPLAATAVVILLLAILAAVEIVRTPARPPGRGLRGLFTGIDAWLERFNPGGIRFGRERKAGFLRGNPVAWLARTSGGIGVGRHTFRIALFSFGLTVVVVSYVAAGAGWAVYLLSIVVPLAVLLPVSAGATAISGERVRKSLPVLLVTPLTGRRILAGKAIAAVSLFVVVAGPPALLVLVLSRVLPEHRSGMIAALILVVGEAACGYNLALVLSIFNDHPMRAGLSAVGLLFVFNAAPVAFAAMFSSHDAVWSTLGVLLWLALVTVPAMIMIGGVREVRREFVLVALLTITLGATFAVFTHLDARRPDYSGIVRHLGFYLSAAALVFHFFARKRIDRTLGRSS